jgi:hypothetical protein
LRGACLLTNNAGRLSIFASVLSILRCFPNSTDFDRSYSNGCRHTSRAWIVSRRFFSIAIPLRNNESFLFFLRKSFHLIESVRTDSLLMFFHRS